MEPELLDVLKEAVEGKQRKEDLIRSIGRAVRRRGLSFDLYIRIVSEVRGLANSRKVDIETAARTLLEGK
ncbi:MAG TPA: hypothetical protein VGB78_03735 [Thermoplasmata archaeon]|jgi:hypothetical protein